MNTALWDTASALGMGLSALRVRIIAVGAILLVTGTVYAPAVSHEILDLDYSCWIQAVQPIGLHTLKRLVTCDPTVWDGVGYFAPLTAVSFMVDLLVGSWTGDPEVVHKAGNILLHLLNCLLVMWVVRALGLELWVAFTTALVFAVHPLQVSTVAWIPERKNLLMGLFFLIALLCHSWYRGNGKYSTYAAVLVAYSLALLAKPSAVAFGPCVFFTDLCLIDRKFTIRAVARAGLLVAMGLAWVFVAAGTELPVENVPPLLERLLQVPYNVGFLLWKFFVPTQLSLLYPPVTVDASSVIWWIPSLLCVFAAGLVACLHRRVPVWSLIWGLAFYVVNVIPSAGIVPFAGMKDLYVADHYQYVASVGLCLLVALAADRVFQFLHLSEAIAVKVVVAATLALVLGLRCSDQLHIWRNPHALWAHVISLNPSSYQAHFNYGTYLHEKQNYSEAVSYYNQALAAGPDRPDRVKLYYNLGLIMVKFGHTAEAAEYFAKAVSVFPGFGLAHAGLAQIYYDQGRYGPAVYHCRLARQHGFNCQAEEMARLIGQMTRNTALAQEGHQAPH